MKKLMLFVGTLCVCAALSYGQGKNDDAKDSRSKRPRIEQTRDNDHEVIRFYDKAGKKTKEFQLGQTETRVVLKKQKAFNAASFGLKISTSVAELLEAGRKRSGRDMAVKRRISKHASVTQDGKYVVVHDSRGDFLEHADGRDVENWEYPEAVETEDSETVYDSDGREVLRLSENDGHGISVSNTGKYFAIGYGDTGGRIINAQKEVLAETPFMENNLYFSENDKYIIFVEGGGIGGATISVYDTENKKLELRKLVVNGSFFQGIDEIKISEPNREIIVQHIWDPKKAEKKLEKVKF